MYQAEAKAVCNVMLFVCCGQPCYNGGWDWVFAGCLDSESKQEDCLIVRSLYLH